MLLVHGEHEKREHGKHHDKGRCGLGYAVFNEKEKRYAHNRRRTKTHKLPLGKVQRNPAFYFCKVFGYCDICHKKPPFCPYGAVSLMCVENALCKASRLEQGKAEYHGVGGYAENGTVQV